MGKGRVAGDDQVNVRDDRRQVGKRFGVGAQVLAQVEDGELVRKPVTERSPGRIAS